MTALAEPATPHAVATPPRPERRNGRLALLVLLGATAVLYLYGLGASGWANSFYSAAVQAATKSWTAVLAGSAIGFGFLAKMFQAFLIVPAIALVYLIAAPTPLRRRIGQTLLGGLAMVVAGGWWVALVALWPAGSRPYIGGSQTNSVLE